MHVSKIAGVAAAALMTVAPAAFAQTATPQTPTGAGVTTTQTFTGCLMKESDYRRAHNLGDGALGGVGLGDEFVLVDVTVSAAKGTAATTPVSDAPAAAPVVASASASTCADKGVAYRLMGSDEEKLKNFVGRHVEVQGRFKQADDTTRAADRIPVEVEIISFSEAPAAAPVSEPAAATTAPVTAPPATQTAPPPPPVAAVETPREPVASPVPVRRELPRTASSTTLLALIGVLALGSGIALATMRRRAL